MRSFPRSNASLIFLACLLVAAPGWAQVTTSTFYGIVTDSTGGVVVGATATLTNLGTGAAATKPSGSDGSFVFDFLRVGSYRLKIEAPGFKAIETSDFELQAGASLRRTFTLEVGAVSETVSVQGAGSLVN